MSQAITDTLQTRLAAIVGDKHVLGEDKIQLRDHGWCEHSQRAKLLVRPASKEELSEVAKLATEMGVKLVAQGGLTGLVDATTTEPDNVIVSTERLNKIIRVDPLQNVLIAEAGVTLAKAHAAAAEHGLTLGVDIPSRDSCTLGCLLYTSPSPRDRG